MKNKKNLIILAICMIFIGIFLLASAFMAGARIDTAMENVKEFFGDSNNLKYKEDYIEPMDKEIVPMGESFPASLIKNLEIEIEAAEVKIISGNDFQVKSTENICKIKQSSDDLKISTERKGFGIFKFFDRVPKIQITVPVNVQLDNLDIELGAGQLISDAGIKTQTGKLKIGAGECKIKNLMVIDGLDVECGAGSVQIEGAITGKSSVECGMGEVKMNLLGNPQDYDYNLKVGMGSVKFNDTEISGLGGNTKSSYSAKNSFKVECGMGAVNIKIGR